MTSVSFRCRVADAFAAAKHAPANPEVAESYRAFIRETMQQFAAMRRQGLDVFPWMKEGQPYRNSREMFHDVETDNHLYFYRTDKSAMPADHPMRADSGIVIRDYHLCYNDVFRAVHDFYGHYFGRNSFGPDGEELAWRNHSVMYSPLAVRAMTAETRAQTCWANFGPHMRRPDGSIPDRGDEDYLPLPDRPYSEQKATLLPLWASGYAEQSPAA